MKTALLILSLFIISLSLPSCKKKVLNEEMTVIKNCTGTYLVFKEKNYKVCNTNQTDSFQDKETVSASFKKLKECKGLEDKIICALAFQFEDIIEVTYIE